MSTDELDAIWARTSEEVHQIRLGVSNVIGQSPYPPLICMHALALVMTQYAQGLQGATVGADGGVPVSAAEQAGFESLPDVVAALRFSADVFHEVHERAKS